MRDGALSRLTGDVEGEGRGPSTSSDNVLLLLLSRFKSCPTLCDPIDSSPRGSPVHGILQARVLEWGAIAFSVTPTRFLTQETETMGKIIF